MTDEPSRNERLKEASRYLRGTIAEGLREEITGAIVEDDQQLVKFHGMYLQDDRDLRPERTRKKMEKAFGFMIRVRIPGGVLTPAQWLALDEVARNYASSGMRMTTRQTVQLHGVIKSNLKATLQAIDAALLNTIAACGDVNRNVMCNVLPEQSRAHAAAIKLARAVSDHLLPRTPAYREIWLDGERIAGGEDEVVEPIYGKTYMPRKFKVGGGGAAVERRRRLRARPRLHRHSRRQRRHRRLERHRRRRHGHDARRARHLSAHRRRARLLRNQGRHRHRRGRGHRAARLGRPRQPQARAAEIHHRRSRRSTPSAPKSRPAPASSSARRGLSSSPRPATATAGARATTAAAISRCSCRTAACATSRRLRQLSALREIAHMHDGEFRITPNQNLIIANVPTGKQAEIEAHRARRRPAGALVGAAAQFDGLRRAADLRARARRERALFARSARRARREACRRTGSPPTTSSSA